MLTKYLSLFLMFVLSTFSLTMANAKETKSASLTGTASFYGAKHHGRKTANGDRFNMYGLTAAHRSLPLGCTIKVTNRSNGKSVVVKVNDRGPFTGNRVLDLSQGAAKQLDFIKQGLTKIDIEVLSLPVTSEANNGRSPKHNARVNNASSKRTSSPTIGNNEQRRERSSTTGSTLTRTVTSGSQSYPGSARNSTGSIGYLDLNYEGSDDSIARLIASSDFK